MAKLDITQTMAAADKLLSQLDNPRHRRIISNYRRHALAEISGNWELIFDPEMTVEDPVYDQILARVDEPLRFRGEQVREHYKKVADLGRNVLVFTEENIAVGDHGFGHEACWTGYFQGRDLRALFGQEALEEDGWYARNVRAVLFWPFDERCRMIGERGREIESEIVSIPEEDVVTGEEAKRLLTPMINELEPWTPDMELTPARR